MMDYKGAIRELFNANFSELLQDLLSLSRKIDEKSVY